MILKQTHIVQERTDPIRLQEYGVGIFQQISTKSALKKALKKNQITVDGVVGSTATFIKGGEIIIYHATEKETNTRLVLTLKVIYEDEYMAVINKPAGILVSGNGFKTVANALAQNLSPSTLFDAVGPKPVHRLDYATTGLLLVGKTSSAITALNKLFEHKEITKTYYAVTIGSQIPAGVIDDAIDDKPASSSFKVVKSLKSERFSFLNLVKLNPRSGRRHQLRKHLLSIGNPILGDTIYFLEGLQLKGKGLYLHAGTLEFIHPFTQEKMKIVASLPKKFRKLFPEEGLLH